MTNPRPVRTLGPDAWCKRIEDDIDELYATKEPKTPLWQSICGWTLLITFSIAMLVQNIANDRAITSMSKQLAERDQLIQTLINRK